ncbi:MAG: AraC family transcriptional regulator [Bacteroidetes bacterium]|nr:AraC family transcriptional regulator [Bacteroidota bacterium]
MIPYKAVIPIHNSLNQYEVYALFLLENNIDELNYGMGKYDYQAGTLITVAPGQIGGREDDGNTFEIKGWALLFHPDLLRCSALENKMEQFSFFSYQIIEALSMAEEERETLKCCFELLKDELENEDKTNQEKIIVSLLEVILNYCLRFYNRQFTTRKFENSDVLARFEQILIDYYKNNKQLEQGISIVEYCSGQLFLSTNYFGDLVKKETGNSPNHFIQAFVLDKAKSALVANHSV